MTSQSESMAARGRPQVTVRVSPEIWEAFGRAATDAGYDRAALLRLFMLWFLRYPDAELPERPGPDGDR